MMPWEEAAQQPAQAAPMPWEEAAAAQAQQPGLMQRIGNELAGKVTQGNQIINSNLNPVAKTLAYVGKVGAGTANDALSAMVPDAVKNLASGAVNTLEQAASHLPGMQSYNNAINNTMQGADQAYQGFAQNHPNIAASAEGIGDIGQLAGNLAMAKGVGDTAINAGKAVYNGIADNPTIASRAAAGEVGQVAPAPETSLPTSKGLFSQGDAKYAAANAAGTVAKPVAVDNFLKQAVEDASQDPQLQQVFGDDAAQKYLKSLTSLQGQELPLPTAQALDIDLREKAAQAFSAQDGALGARYKAIRQALRDNIYDNPDPTHFTGGPNGFSALQEGNKLYSQGYKAEQVENMITEGMKAEVPSTGIKTQFKTLARQIRENGAAGWTPAQVDAINSAAETGALTGFLKGMGSRLGAAVGGAVGAGIGSVGGPVGAAFGGTVGTGAGYLAGAPFRAGATALQRAKAEAVLKAITK